jgi:hypothetical protein
MIAHSSCLVLYTFYLHLYSHTYYASMTNYADVSFQLQKIITYSRYEYDAALVCRGR